MCEIYIRIILLNHSLTEELTLKSVLQKQAWLQFPKSSRVGVGPEIILSSRHIQKKTSFQLYIFIYIYILYIVT